MVSNAGSTPRAYHSATISSTQAPVKADKKGAFKPVTIDPKSHPAINQMATDIVSHQTRTLEDYHAQNQTLGKQIVEGEKTINILKDLLIRSHPDFDISNLSMISKDAEIKKTALKTYEQYMEHFKGNKPALHEHIRDLIKDQKAYVDALKEAQAKLEPPLPPLPKGTVPADAPPLAKTSSSSSSSSPASTSSAPAKERVTEHKEAVSQSTGASSAAQTSAVTSKSIEESASFAKKYLADPKHKFVGEGGILDQMKEGDKITLSRKQLQQLGQGNIPHSVLIVKDSSKQPEGYRLFFTPHDRNLEHTVNYDDKKFMADGGYNKVTRLSTQDQEKAINRQPGKKDAQKGVDEIREDKVLRDMKGKSEYVLTPIGNEPGEEVQANLKPLIAGTPFKIVQGQVMPKFDKDGAKFIGFDISKNTSTSLPSVANTVELLDSMTHGFADLHENNIYQLDVKLQNTGVFISEENGKKKLKMVLHDFGKAANLEHPTNTTEQRGPKTVETNELLDFISGGTVITMSPEQAGGVSKETSDKIKALREKKAQIPTEDRAANEAVDKEIEDVYAESYSKQDSYSMALMAYTLISGKLPPQLVPISKLPEFRARMRISSLDVKIGPPGSPPEETNAMGEAMRADLLEAAEKARGPGETEKFDPKLLDLVLRGLNTDPSKRPSPTEFQAYFHPTT